MNKEELKKYELQKNPSDFVSRRRETITSVYSEINLLIQRNISETKKYNGKILYSFPCGALAFSSEMEVISYNADPEINIGLYQIQKVQILNSEKTGNGIECSQKLNVSFLKHLRDYDKEDQNNPLNFKFKECGIMSVNIEEINIHFSDDKKCIFGQEQALYFVSTENYLSIKDFISSGLKNFNISK